MIPILWIAGGIFAGAVIGYGVIQNRKIRELTSAAMKQLPSQIKDIRLPQPDFAMKLPEEPEDYEIIDQIVCECVSMITGATPETIVEETQMCAAKKLFPDFPWPPISGDHPSVSTLWTILGYQASRSITTNGCPVKIPVSMYRQGRKALRINSVRRR